MVTSKFIFLLVITFIKYKMKHWTETSNYTGRTPRTLEEAWGPYTTTTGLESEPKKSYWPKFFFYIGVIYILFAAVVFYNAISK